MENKLSNLPFDGIETITDEAMFAVRGGQSMSDERMATRGSGCGCGCGCGCNGPEREQVC